MIHIFQVFSIRIISLIMSYRLGLLLLFLDFKYPRVFNILFRCPNAIDFSTLLWNLIELNIIFILLLIILRNSHRSLIYIITRKGCFHLSIFFLMVILLWNNRQNLLRSTHFFNRTKYDLLFILFEFLAWFRIRESAILNILTIFSILIENQFWKACNTTSPFTLFRNRVSMSGLRSPLFSKKIFLGPKIGRLKPFFIRIWIRKR